MADGSYHQTLEDACLSCGSQKDGKSIDARVSESNSCLCLCCFPQAPLTLWLLVDNLGGSRLADHNIVPWSDPREEVRLKEGQGLAGQDPFG
jgi:hypothetical protein